MSNLWNLGRRCDSASLQLATEAPCTSDSPCTSCSPCTAGTPSARGYIQWFFWYVPKAAEGRPWGEVCGACLRSQSCKMRTPCRQESTRRSSCWPPAGSQRDHTKNERRAETEARSSLSVQNPARYLSLPLPRNPCHPQVDDSGSKLLQMPIQQPLQGATTCYLQSPPWNPSTQEPFGTLHSGNRSNRGFQPRHGTLVQASVTPASLRNRSAQKPPWNPTQTFWIRPAPKPSGTFQNCSDHSGGSIGQRPNSYLNFSCDVDPLLIKPGLLLWGVYNRSTLRK